MGRRSEPSGMLDIIFKQGKGWRVARPSHGKYAGAEWKTKPHRVSIARIIIRVVLRKEWKPLGTSEQLLIRSELSIGSCPSKLSISRLKACRQEDRVGAHCGRQTDSGKNGKGGGGDHIPKEE